MSKHLTEEDRAIWGDIQVRAWARGYRQNIAGILQHYWAADREDFEWAAITLGECGSIAETVKDWEEHLLAEEEL